MAVDTLKIEEKTPVETAVKQEVVHDRVVIWYHMSDVKLIGVLEDHLQLLMLRLGKQFLVHFFHYPTRIPTPETEKECFTLKKDREEYQARYERTIWNLEHAALFLPCVSNECMTQMWKDTERDPRLKKLFAQRAFEILPVHMRPTNTGQSNQPVALSAYEGHQLDLTCQQIAATIEGMLRAHPHYQEPKPTPLATLFLQGPAPQVVTPTPKKHWWSFFS
jgi:hypothetical protein